MKTNQLICKANHISGFHMKGKMVKGKLVIIFNIVEPLFSGLFQNPTYLIGKS